MWLAKAQVSNPLLGWRNQSSDAERLCKFMCQFLHSGCHTFTEGHYDQNGTVLGFAKTTRGSSAQSGIALRVDALPLPIAIHNGGSNLLLQNCQHLESLNRRIPETVQSLGGQRFDLGGLGSQCVQRSRWKLFSQLGTLDVTPWTDNIVASG